MRSIKLPNLSKLVKQRKTQVEKENIQRNILLYYNKNKLLNHLVKNMSCNVEGKEDKVYLRKHFQQLFSYILKMNVAVFLKFQFNFFFRRQKNQFGSRYLVNLLNKMVFSASYTQVYWYKARDAFTLNTKTRHICPVKSLQLWPLRIYNRWLR